MKKKAKHPKDMTSDELVKHIFHPKVVRHAKKAIKHVAGKQKLMKEG